MLAANLSFCGANRCYHALAPIGYNSSVLKALCGQRTKRTTARRQLFLKKMVDWSINRQEYAIRRAVICSARQTQISEIVIIVHSWWVVTVGVCWMRTISNCSVEDLGSIVSNHLIEKIVINSLTLHLIICIAEGRESRQLRWTKLNEMLKHLPYPNHYSVSFIRISQKLLPYC